MGNLWTWPTMLPVLSGALKWEQRYDFHKGQVKSSRVFGSKLIVISSFS